jgi:DNA-binding transcriptional ArsR family regulator
MGRTGDAPREISRPLEAVNAAPIFAALGDESRLQIVARLCRGGPQSIVQLTGCSNISRQAVTKHLNALSKAGLVRSERFGRERVWELRPKALSDARRYLDQISAQWGAALVRLQALVEKEDVIKTRAP